MPGDKKDDQKTEEQSENHVNGDKNSESCKDKEATDPDEKSTANGGDTVPLHLVINGDGHSGTL